ncbi:unnamed protein product [Lupinus luteus]|uniref:peroxidase n=1 Tax=Lupinus luteus TaxID=3873 RepID=A0AAV1WXP7_LUPLU
MRRVGDQVEKSSGFNGLLLKGADLIDDIKSKLEQECPQTVSCADTLVFATNEALILSGLPHQRPLGGRRDTLTSLAKMADDNNLPAPNWPLEKMIETSKKKGFNEEEMVILLGAHSVGSTHCDFILYRAYNYKKTNKPDPTLPEGVVDEIKKVQQMAANPALFHKRFMELMKKLSTLNVLTGKDGELKRCGTLTLVSTWLQKTYTKTNYRAISILFPTPRYEHEFKHVIIFPKMRLIGYVATGFLLQTGQLLTAMVSTIDLVMENLDCFMFMV